MQSKFRYCIGIHPQMPCLNGNTSFYPVLLLLLLLCSAAASAVGLARAQRHMHICFPLQPIFKSLQPDEHIHIHKHTHRHRFHIVISLSAHQNHRSLVSKHNLKSLHMFSGRRARVVPMPLVYIAFLRFLCSIRETESPCIARRCMNGGQCDLE